MRRLVLLAVAALAIARPGGAQWMNVPRGASNVAASAPRAADGHPDLSGIWMAENQRFFQDLAAGLRPDEVAALPWARALSQQRESRLHSDDPLAHCLPHGVPRINTNSNFPFKIVQTPGLVVILYEQLTLFRQVFMDGRWLADDLNPTWLGYSTGRWEGDSLVVETRGFNDKTWLDTNKGRPATEALHVTERFRRPTFGTLEIVATVDDPKTYEKPWTTAPQRLRLQSGTELLEMVCLENEKDSSHLVGK